MKCALCGKDFEATKNGFLEHDKLEHHQGPEYDTVHLTVTTINYIIALQKRIEDLEQNKTK